MRPDLAISACNDMAYSIVNKLVSDPILKEDAYQEAMVGILEANKKYKKSLGVSFSSYAYYYIYRKVYTVVHEKGVVSSKQYEKPAGIQCVQYIDEMHHSKDEIENIITRLDLTDTIKKALRRFPKVNRNIFLDYYGLGGRKERDVAYLAKRTKYSKSNIYRILEEMLDYLKKSIMIKDVAFAIREG